MHIEERASREEICIVGIGHYLEFLGVELGDVDLVCVPKLDCTGHWLNLLDG